MTLSELIRALTTLSDQGHGDLTVIDDGTTCRSCPAPAGRPTGDCPCCCHRALQEAQSRRQMSRGDRRMNMCLDPSACDGDGDHRWQPVSFVFESQLLDPEGRPRVRQPDIKEGRVYVVCMECRAHSYVVTEWAGFFLGGPDYSALGMEDRAGNLPEDEEVP